MGIVKRGKIEGYTGNRFLTKLKRTFAFATLMTILFVISMGYTQTFDIPESNTEYRNLHYVEYVKNYDGDTITVNLVGYNDIIGKEIPIRIRGVDTPEIKGKCITEKVLAIRAKRFVEYRMINAKKIMVLNPERGSFFRIVGDVWYDGNDLAAQLLNQELAVPYDRNDKSNPWCE